MAEYILIHHGVKGQKWYQRRYQNPDGTLTDAGRKRYAKATAKADKLNKQASEDAYTAAKRKHKAEKYARKHPNDSEAINKLQQKSSDAELKAAKSKRKSEKWNARVKQLDEATDKALDKADKALDKIDKTADKVVDTTVKKVDQYINAVKDKKLAETLDTDINNGYEKAKSIANKYKNTKIETDEEKITRLMNDGKISSKAHHVFDQNGNLMMVYWDD